MDREVTAMKVSSGFAPHSKVSYPPPDFVWKSGSDVQATWRRFGWTPPSETMTPPPQEKK
jgi:hypothetical protein